MKKKDKELSERHIQQLIRRMTMEKIKPSGKVYKRKKNGVIREDN